MRGGSGVKVAGSGRLVASVAISCHELGCMACHRRFCRFARSRIMRARAVRGPCARGYLVWRRLRFITELYLVVVFQVNHAGAQSHAEAEAEAEPDAQAEAKAVDRKRVERFRVSSHHGSAALAIGRPAWRVCGASGVRRSIAQRFAPARDAGG